MRFSSILTLCNLSLLLSACAPMPDIRRPEGLAAARAEARQSVEKREKDLRGYGEPEVVVQLLDAPDRCSKTSGGCTWFSHRDGKYHIQIHTYCTHNYLIAVHEYTHVYLNHTRAEGADPISLTVVDGEQDHRWMDTYSEWNGAHLRCPEN